MKANLKSSLSPFSLGFTLIELLVAVSIFAAVATVLYTTLYTGIKAYQRTQAQLQLNRDIYQVAEKLSVELRTSVRPYAFMFEEGKSGQLGNEHSLSFFTNHNAYTEEGMRKQIARMSYIFHAGTLFKKQQLDGDAFLDEDAFGEVALLTNIESFSFHYLSFAGPEEEEKIVSWQPTWSCKDAMPRGVRMEVVWRDPTTNTRASLDHYITIVQGALNCTEGGLPD